MLPAIDPDEYFIEVPFITGSRPPAAQFVDICLTKLEAPFSDRLISNDDATHSHDLFDITEALERSGSRACDPFSRNSLTAGD